MKDVVQIPLSGIHGLGKYALIDKEDLEKVSKFKWHINDMGYAVNRHKGKNLRMHRLVNQTPEGMVTDHKNGDRLDNRKSNLRTVTQKQNANNRKGDKGYSWDKSKNKWIVRYKSTFYGRYVTEEEAKQAYKLACSGVPYIKSTRKLRHLPTGVSRLRGSKNYLAKIQVNGKRYYMGTFKTIEEAEKAYINTKKELSQ